MEDLLVLLGGERGNNKVSLLGDQPSAWFLPKISPNQLKMYFAKFGIFWVANQPVSWITKGTRLGVSSLHQWIAESEYANCSRRETAGCGRSPWLATSSYNESAVKTKWDLLAQAFPKPWTVMSMYLYPGDEIYFLFRLCFDMCLRRILWPSVSMVYDTFHLNFSTRRGAKLIHWQE